MHIISHSSIIHFYTVIKPTAPESLEKLLHGIINTCFMLITKKLIRISKNILIMFYS